MKKLSKLDINLLIDILMFILMVAIAGIGFLIKFVLVPGFKSNELYGRKVDLYFAGINRHQWGDIHLILSFILLFLLFLHIIFHWKLVVGYFRKKFAPLKYSKYIVFSLIISSFILIAFPLMVKPTVISNNNEVAIKKHFSKDLNYKKTCKNANLQFDIKGSMSINEIASLYNLNSNKLASYLHVPCKYMNKRIGRLNKKYRFNMGMIKSYLAENVK
jgi:hypothetical protein